MEFTKPDRNIDELHLNGSERLVVFGSGAGGHSFAALRALHGGGKVCALDPRSAMVEKLKSDATRLSLGALTAKVANFEVPGGSGLMGNSYDVAVIPNTLYASSDRLGVLREAFRVVRPGGTVLIVDWTDSFGGMGPQPDHVVPEDKARSLAEKAGFTFERDFIAGAQHYGLIMRKPQH